MSGVSADLERLLRHPGVWRAGARGGAAREGLASGIEALDALLPGGGWPRGALTEVLSEGVGIGELGLVMPALARLSREGRRIVWVSPPYLPYAPALAQHGLDLSQVLLVRAASGADALWVAEQALRSGSCGALLLWPEEVDGRALRRLQLAAETGRAWGVLYRRAEEARHPSPAALRLSLASSPEGGACLRVLKCRGRGPSGPLRIDLPTPGLAREGAGPRVVPAVG